MSSDDNKDAEEFEGTDAGCALTEPIRAGEVKKGMVVMLKGHPCKVIDISVSKPGKHGHAKGKITGTDIFTALKYIDISPMAHNMTKPIVKVESYLLMDTSGYNTDGDEPIYCSLMNDDGETRGDIRLPDRDSPDRTLGDKLAKLLAEGQEINVTVTAAMGMCAITAFKVTTEQE
jgi:translation initiation factor 5A